MRSNARVLPVPSYEWSLECLGKRTNRERVWQRVSCGGERRRESERKIESVVKRRDK